MFWKVYLLRVLSENIVSLPFFCLQFVSLFRVIDIVSLEDFGLGGSS